MRFGMKSSSSSRRSLRLEGIVETREHGCAFRSIANIHVAHHVGARNAPEPDAKDLVYVTQRIGAGPPIYTAEVRERRNLDVEKRRDGVESEHLAAQFDGGGEGIAIVKSPGAEPTQRLLPADHALTAADGAERP